MSISDVRVVPGPPRIPTTMPGGLSIPNQSLKATPKVQRKGLKHSAWSQVIVTSAMIIPTLQDETKRQNERRMQAPGLLQGLISSKHQQYVENQMAGDIWAFSWVKFLGYIANGTDPSRGTWTESPPIGKHAISSHPAPSNGST
ncbi:hypothetical protein MMC22_003882 [Lobaria immixta]|nr:hypothetical protein [Lobaria immixta]